MKTLRLISRLITGIVFIFSGFVKAVDPLGSTYKFTDYFNAFHLGFLGSLALPLAVFLSSTELVLGITLLLGYRMRTAAWVLLVFMSFFTVLTFILALTNPVTDCGCFGDALIITNWQTFFKNVVLMVFVLIIFFGRTQYPVIRNVSVEWVLVSLFFAGAVFFSLYNYRHLPVLDFRPYAVGTNIEEGMTIPEGAPEDKYSTELIYKNKKTGEEKTFSMSDFPRDTLSWEFVDARSELVEKGYEPPIHNFNIVAPDGVDITDHILSAPGFTFLLITYDAESGDTSAFKDANNLFHLSQALPGLDFYAVTASNEEVLANIKETTGIDYDFCLADEITLKTIVRSNPGLLLLKDGTITAKWGSRDFPGKDDLRVYADVFDNYPLCVGCSPGLISQPPFGSVPSKLETVLMYRNLETDSIEKFTIENFPRDNSKWAFVDSETKTKPGGFRSPFSDLNITSVYGTDFTQTALQSRGVTFLVYLREPFELNPLLFQKINLLAGMAGDHLDVPYQFYGLTSMPENDILRFTDENLSPMEFYHVPPGAMDIAAYNEVLIVMLEDGNIVKVWNDEVPGPSFLDSLHRESLRPAGEVLLPNVLKNCKKQADKRLVYMYLFAFFTFVFLVRTILGNPGQRNRNV